MVAACLGCSSEPVEHRHVIEIKGADKEDAETSRNFAIGMREINRLGKEREFLPEPYHTNSAAALSAIMDEYDRRQEIAKQSESKDDELALSKWYRGQVEGKSIADFLPESDQAALRDEGWKDGVPFMEFLAEHHKARTAKAREKVEAEMARLIKEMEELPEIDEHFHAVTMLKIQNIVSMMEIRAKTSQLEGDEWFLEKLEGVPVTEVQHVRLN
jgi:hypothetical protein